ncbi:NAD(P)H-quinone oxidoreductase [Haliea sp.]|jgi:NADPH2:quinone reductase|uniref:NAD(P)H-quinone oxidoreductase n=1 Tax=Haliea TaxID=475794 RepID=UPI000C5A6B88|nr:NAD(P)H-quinone oxidoreductase [Haliea sp.]HCD56838.1 NAD(P)H-quinone oxidoreductase [Halieaceae bacterium]MAD63503.1 NAD(P)H-quinone oxidoreductase [Haliea sp.]MAY93429.1 NAD(P)H-quinone oxidoreductase [Haliea sp.]MBK41188.1 NAD(P)H-quinone oxidoreductase [Haliea sp.]MBP71378.1 NAD(P)H-quinone oxidoreductase [Haliea sp.]|tara:strand:- start:7 stop:987 length:981 start_codon:yes stop_codon:yes gene_type:complete
MQCIEISEPGAPAVLKAAQREAPVARAGELLISVFAAGVNRPDVMQRLGLYPAPPGASDLPGLEVAGEVAAVGAGVTGWQVGDRVCALTNGGGYAEQAVAPAGQCLPVPAGMDFVAAAGLPETFFTVWTNVFMRGGLQAGESLLVHGGSSGIGTSAIQMARAMGATVYATAGSAEKCAACVELGADLAVNYRNDDFETVLLERTGGAGVNVILDMVGGDYINRNIRLAATDGRIVNIAFQGGFETSVNFVPILLKRLTLTASTLRPQSAEAKAAIAAQLLERIWPRLESGDISPVIAATFPLQDAAAAHELMESSAHIGKIILTLR